MRGATPPAAPPPTAARTPPGWRGSPPSPPTFPVGTAPPPARDGCRRPPARARDRAGPRSAPPHGPTDPPGRGSRGTARRPPPGGPRGPYPLGVDAQRGDCPGRGGEYQCQSVESVEQQRLVLLEVLAVSRREPLQGREQRHEVAQQPARLRTCELEDVGVAFLRQQARAGAEVVRQPHEAELRARIQHDLGREA